MRYVSVLQTTNHKPQTAQVSQKMNGKLLIAGIAAVATAAVFLFFFLQESTEIVNEIDFANERNVSFQEIELIDLPRHEAPSKSVINNQEDFLELWQGTANSGISRPPVDFSKETVVAVFMGSKNTGGYSIEIVKIVEQTDKIIVYVRETSPKPGDAVTLAFTYPQHIVKTEKLTKRVVFQSIE